MAVDVALVLLDVLEIAGINEVQAVFAAARQRPLHAGPYGTVLRGQFRSTHVRLASFSRS